MIHPTDNIRGKYVEAFERQLLEQIEEGHTCQMRKEATAEPHNWTEQETAPLASGKRLVTPLGSDARA